MSKRAWKRALTATAGALAVTAALAAASGGGPAKDEAGQEAQQTDLEVVETSEVCMVNDRFFGREQIPVEVEGKTYYGCCEGCKTRLAEDEGIRYGVDPVSGEKVDKATAVIAARPDGSVLYFTSRETLERYDEDSP